MNYDPTKPLTQEIFIKLDQKIANLSSKEKTKLIDSIGNSGGAKGLIIDFDFSHTGRRINRRIYSKKGHLRVADDLYRPYPKPITIDHTGTATSTIGRIISASYVDMMEEAKAFFKKRKVNENYLFQLDSALSTLDYEKAVDAFKRSKVLLATDWKGIGRIAAKGKITDPDAIIKFIDQRYLTLSAEQETDAYVCSICFNDWKSTGGCEHIPGAVYDNQLAFMLCGNMSGEGSSVVANPADPDSIVTNISLSDKEDLSSVELMSQVLDTTIVDSNIFIEDDKMEYLTKFLNDEKLTKEERFELYNQLEGDSKLTSKEYDVLPDSVLTAGAFFITDKESAMAVASFIDKNLPVDFNKETSQNLKTTFAKVSLFIDQEPASTPSVDLIALFEDSNTVASIDKNKFIDFITKHATELQLIKENAISQEEVDALNDKVRGLESQVNLLEDKITQAETQNGLFLREKEKNRLLTIEYKNLVKDHLSILNNLEDSLEKNKLLLDKVSPILAILKPDAVLTDKKSENFIEILDSVNIDFIESKLNDGISNLNIKPEDDPTAASVSKLSSLTDYEKKVVANYKNIIESEGKVSATKYFNKVKAYCSKSFNPTNFLE